MIYDSKTPALEVAKRKALERVEKFFLQTSSATPETSSALSDRPKSTSETEIGVIPTPGGGLKEANDQSPRNRTYRYSPSSPTQQQKGQTNNQGSTSVVIKDESSPISPLDRVGLTPTKDVHTQADNRSMNSPDSSLESFFAKLSLLTLNDDDAPLPNSYTTAYNSDSSGEQRHHHDRRKEQPPQQGGYRVYETPTTGAISENPAHQLVENQPPQHRNTLPPVADCNGNNQYICEQTLEWLLATEAGKDMPNSIFTYDCVILCCHSRGNFSRALQVLRLAQERAGCSRFYFKDAVPVWDLHNMSLAVACTYIIDALLRLVAFDLHLPMEIVVVTGKGLRSGPDGPVLKDRIPEFLRTQLCLDTVAVPGNDGAVSIKADSLHRWMEGIKSGRSLLREILMKPPQNWSNEDIAIIDGVLGRSKAAS